MKHITNVFVLLFLSWAMLSVIPACRSDKTEREPIPEDTVEHLYLLDICIDTLDVEDCVLKPGENLSVVLTKLGISAGKIDSLSKCCEGVFDITKMKAGNPYTLLRDTSLANILYFIYQERPTHYTVFDLRNPLRVYNYQKDITFKSKEASGVITSSLWNAISDAGNDLLLSDHLSNIYAWQIDFFGIAKGDWFKVLYDQACIDDTVEVEIAGIQGAVFSHVGVLYYAIPFAQDSTVSYFDENGQNLQKAFLKAPLKFSRISSRFSNARRHPVLKIVRPHHGVDYAAPTGTPVVSIGEGTVIKKAYQGGGAGNYLVIRHNSVYTTTYMHLSRFAKGIKVGSRVRQGELIGYVGRTGLATGPHLDFRVHKNGTPVNPLTIDSPPADSIRPEMRDSFEVVKRRVMARLDSIVMENDKEPALADTISSDTIFL